MTRISLHSRITSLAGSALVSCLLSAPLAAPAAAYTLDVTGTTDWVAVGYYANPMDYLDDQQTGIPESDIVGDATYPGFWATYDDNGTLGDNTDDYVGFRVRLGYDKPPPGFDKFFGVGYDADLDGDLDIFVGIDASGNPNNIGVWDAGTGLNNSPSTTSIESPPLYEWRLDATNLTTDPQGFLGLDQDADSVLDLDNFDFSRVSVVDPGMGDIDLDNPDDGEDMYLSIAVPFEYIVLALAAQGINIDETTLVRYVIGTAAQDNALNQDIGGVNGGENSTDCWECIGGFSSPQSPNNPVPEPASGLLVGLGLGALALARRRSR